jgi:branched-chain amino acid transport system ATP-binding protein
MLAPVLETEDIEFSYGPLQVLFGVGVAVADGERVGLLGTNGAGKSTLLGVLSGSLKPTRGRVRLFGEDVTGREPHELVDRGLMQIAGGRAMFPSLSVRDNIRLGAYRRLRRDTRVEAKVSEALDIFPFLRDRIGQPAGSLSGGEQQMVALSRAYVSEARLLLIDEVSLGLAPTVVADVLRMVETLAGLGVAMVLVEQSLNVALSLTSRAYFMERGEIRFSGPTSKLTGRSDLVRAVFWGDRSKAAAR